MYWRLHSNQMNRGLLVKDQHRKSKKFKLEILLITQFVGAASLFFFLLRNEAVQWGVMWTTWWTAVIWATCAFIASCILLHAMVVIFRDGGDDAITPKVHNGVRGPGKYLVPALSGYSPVGWYTKLRPDFLKCNLKLASTTKFHLVWTSYIIIKQLILSV